MAIVLNAGLLNPSAYRIKRVIGDTQGNMLHLNLGMITVKVVECCSVWLNYSEWLDNWPRGDAKKLCHPFHRYILVARCNGDVVDNYRHSGIIHASKSLHCSTLTPQYTATLDKRSHVGKRLLPLLAGDHSHRLASCSKSPRYGLPTQNRCPLGACMTVQPS